MKIEGRTTMMPRHRIAGLLFLGLTAALARAACAASSPDDFLVVDGDKHPFDELVPISVDLDKDGKNETIQPRTYSKPRDRQDYADVWIAFDLRRATGKTQKDIFRYLYGNEHSHSWIWALKPAGDVNRDGTLDLVFYTGDDTTDEMVFLLQKGSRFEARSSGSILCDCFIGRDYNVTATGSYDLETKTQAPDRTVARWNPQRERYEGTELHWVSAPKVEIRTEPRSAAPSVFTLGKDDAVLVVFEQGRPVREGTWLKVESEYGSGWVERDALVSSSHLTQP
jgi:hypothetical protein